MPKKELTKEKQIEVLIANLHRTMIADMRAGKMVLNADLRKKKAHYEYQHALEELNNFKKDFS